ncbi:MAG: hypothetical protein ACE5KM_20345, partial [Planctomycetaceae bacterium]
PQKASGQMPADRNELLRVSIRWSVLQAALSDDRSFWSALVPSPNAKRPAADRVHLSITLKGEELIVRARLEEDVLRQVARSLAGRFARPVSTRK